MHVYVIDKKQGRGERGYATDELPAATELEDGSTATVRIRNLELNLVVRNAKWEIEGLDLDEIARIAEQHGYHVVTHEQLGSYVDDALIRIDLERRLRDSRVMRWAWRWTEQYEVGPDA